MKRLRNLLVIGGILGLFLIQLQTALHLPPDRFLIGYCVVGSLVIIGAVAVNLLYFCFYNRKLLVALALFESGNTVEFIQQLEQLRKTAKGRYLQSLLSIHLSAGYADLKQYTKAIDLLKQLPSRSLHGTLKMVYHLNLCVCYFYNGQTCQALQLYSESQKEFAVFANTTAYGGNCAVLDIFAAMERGETERAAELLTSAKARWPAPRLQEDYACFSEKLKPAQ